MEAKFILTATRSPDKSRLHLIKSDVGYCQWVVCWNYSPSNNSWDWGSYCNNLKAALKVFIQKYDEHGFDDVVEGYVDENDIKGECNYACQNET